MKLLILGSAFKRDEALAHLENNSDQIRDHIIRCVVYKDIRPEDMHHWIYDELGVWLSKASHVQSKSKLKKSDYLDYVFGALGDEFIDCKILLSEFRESYCNPKLDDPYPEFLIDRELVSKLFDACNKIKTNTLPLLISKNGGSSEDFGKILSKIFN